MLTTSEPAIYGRFGYGIATLRTVLDVDTVRAGLLLPEGAERVRLRLVPPEEGIEVCEAVYERVVPRRPGMPARQPGWERLPVIDPPSERNGASNPRAFWRRRRPPLAATISRACRTVPDVRT